MLVQLKDLITKSEKGIYLVLIAISITIGMLQLYFFRNYMVDDAFISLRYVRNALEGHGLVYNIGERVEGFTSPLYILLNYILGLTGIDLVVSSKILGIAAYISILAFVCAWSLFYDYPRKMDVAASTIVVSIIATSFPLTFFAITGMETVLFSFLTLMVFFEALKSKITLRLVTLIFLAFLCRPEGISFLFWIGLGIVLVRRSDFDPHDSNSRKFLFFDHDELLKIGFFALAVFIFLIIRWQYYGEILPNTFVAKTPWTMASLGVHWTLKGLGSIIYFFSATGGLLGILIVLSALFKKTSSYPALIMCVMLVAAMMFFQKYAGSDWMIGARYFIPALPVWALGLGISITGLNIFRDIKLAAYRVIITCILLSSIWIMNISESNQFLRNKNAYPNNVQTSIGLEKIGVWIKDNIPADFRIRNWRIGAIGYYCENPILDTWGLVNHEIAMLRFRANSEEAGNKVVKEYIAKANPEVLITVIRTSENQEERGYSLVYKSPNGDEMLGVWVRNDLVQQIKSKKL